MVIKYSLQAWLVLHNRDKKPWPSDPLLEQNWVSYGPFTIKDF